jgi:hypothetical protein
LQPGDAPDIDATSRSKAPRSPLLARSTRSFVLSCPAIDILISPPYSDRAAKGASKSAKKDATDLSSTRVPGSAANVPAGTPARQIRRRDSSPRHAHGRKFHSFCQLRITMHRGERRAKHRPRSGVLSPFVALEEVIRAVGLPGRMVAGSWKTWRGVATPLPHDARSIRSRPRPSRSP